MSKTLLSYEEGRPNGAETHNIYNTSLTWSQGANIRSFWLAVKGNFKYKLNLVNQDKDTNIIKFQIIVSP